MAQRTRIVTTALGVTFSNIFRELSGSLERFGHRRRQLDERQSVLTSKTADQPSRKSSYGAEKLTHRVFRFFPGRCSQKNKN